MRMSMGGKRPDKLEKNPGGGSPTVVSRSTWVEDSADQKAAAYLVKKGAELKSVEGLAFPRSST